MKRTRDILRGDSGLSMAELMVVTVLLGMIMSAAYFVLVTVQSISNGVEGRVIASDEARIGIDRMSRELRQAEELVEGQGVFAQADSRECVFWADVDQDGRPEKVRYYVVGNSVYRQEAAATTALPPYTYGTYAAPTRMISSLDPAWTSALFTYLPAGSSATPLGPSEIPDMSAVSVRVVNLAKVGDREIRVDESTWVKIRSVHNVIQ